MFYSRQEMYLIVIGTANRLRNKQNNIPDSWAKKDHIREIDRGEIAMMEAISSISNRERSHVLGIEVWLSHAWIEKNEEMNTISKVAMYPVIFDAIFPLGEKEIQKRINNLFDSK